MQSEKVKKGTDTTPQKAAKQNAAELRDDELDSISGGRIQVRIRETDERP